MVRRILAIPLAVVVAIAVFLCPVMGSPINDQSGSFDVLLTSTFSSSSSVGDRFCSIENLTLQYGTTFFRAYQAYDVISLDYSVSYNYISTFEFTLQSPINNIFVPVRSVLVSNSLLDFSSLCPYYFPAGNLSQSVDVSCDLYTYAVSNYDFSNRVQSISTHTKTYDITYLCFRNVPNGTYSISDASAGIIIGDHRASLIVAGVYIDYFSSPSSVVDDYLSGSLSFPDAVSDLSDSITDNFNNAQSIDEKSFVLLQGQYELDRLIQASNNKSISDINSSVVPSFQSTVSDFNSGSLSLSDALSSLNSGYESALASAETPEQGILVNTSYQIFLKKLEIESRQKAFSKLDSAVSDDQLSEAEEYYQSEEELIDMFQIAEFESALDFNLWFNTLPPSETIEYKKFFDFLLNDSSIRMFLVVPISLILVRILLGTRLVLSRGGHYSAKGDE